VRLKTIRAFTVAGMSASSLLAQVAHSASPNDARKEEFSSRDQDYVFEIHRGQGSKVIKGFNASLGQKIRLIGFGSMSLDQVRSGLKADGADALLDLGDQNQLRIVEAGTDVVSSIQVQLDRAGLTPTFSDEFDALSLDLEKNSTQEGTWRTNFGYGEINSYTLVNNGELEVYVDQQFSGTGSKSLNLNPFRIVDGKLEIIAKPLDESQRQFTWGRSYSSGLLTSKRSFNQMYGLFEIRAKMPRGKGLWPAFWLLPSNGGWPPELDVLEILGDNLQKLYVSWHSNAGGEHTSETKGIDVPDTSEGFHTYSVYWTKDIIEWYFDDIEVASKPTPQDFHQPMYMLVNLAVGGTWPGLPDKTTQFPARYTIDWIRAYGRKDAR
jgi:serralysin